MSKKFGTSKIYFCFKHFSFSTWSCKVNTHSSIWLWLGNRNWCWKSFRTCLIVSSIWIFLWVLLWLFTQYWNLVIQFLVHFLLQTLISGRCKTIFELQLIYLITLHILWGLSFLKINTVLINLHESLQKCFIRTSSVLYQFR